MNTNLSPAARGMKVRDRNPNDSSINNNYHKHLIIFCFGLMSFMYSFPAIMTHFCGFIFPMHHKNVNNEN